MDDLVKRIREFAIHTPLSKPMLLKAADRIEGLEQDVKAVQRREADANRADHSAALVAAAREEALREAAEVAAEEANWVPHKSDDFRKAILALITKDADNG